MGLGGRPGLGPHGTPPGDTPALCPQSSVVSVGKCMDVPLDILMVLLLFFFLKFTFLSQNQ